MIKLMEWMKTHWHSCEDSGAREDTQKPRVLAQVDKVSSAYLYPIRIFEDEIETRKTSESGICIEESAIVTTWNIRFHRVFVSDIEMERVF